MYSDSTRIDSAGGDGPAARAAGDIRQDHAVFARRDPPDAAEKSRPAESTPGRRANPLTAGRIRPEGRPGPRVIYGKPLPDIVLPSLDGGRPVRLSEYRGQKLILQIFASW